MTSTDDTATDDAVPVSLSGRSGLLAAVPALLGFHPHASLVMLCLAGPRRRLGPIVRIDLADLGPRSIAGLLGHANRYADEVALLVYTSAAPLPVPVPELVDQLESGGVPVLDTVMIRDGRAGSIPPGASEPADWSAVPDSQDPQVRTMTAVAALNGRGILPDREALARSISGPVGTALEAAGRAFAAAADDLLALLETRSMTAGPDPVVERTRATADAALAEVQATGRLALEAAAGLALLVCDVQARDDLITRLMVDVESAWVPTLVAAATQVLDRDAADLCAVLAMSAYRHGDGALAQVAVDRCLATAPDHRLAHLLLAAMAAGMPPQDLAGLASPDTDG